MYPQSNTEALALQSLRESGDIGKFVGIELGGAVAGLPLVVDLELTIVKLVGDDLVRIRLHHIVVDVGFISGPSGPYRIANHPFIGMTYGLAQMSTHNVLMSGLGIRKDAQLVTELDAVAVSIGRLVLGDQYTSTCLYNYSGREIMDPFRFRKDRHLCWIASNALTLPYSLDASAGTALHRSTYVARASADIVIAVHRTIVCPR